VTTVLVLLCLVVAVQLLLIIGLLRSHAEILRRLHELGAGLDRDLDVAPGTTGPEVAPGVVPPGPPPPAEGRTAHDLSGVTPQEEVRALRLRGVDHDTILVFLSSTCAGCQPFWDELSDPGVPEGTRLVIVTREEPDEDAAAISALTPRGATVVMSSTAWEDHQVPGSPYVVLVDGGSGRIRGEGTAGTWPAVRALLLRGSGGERSTRAKATADVRRERDADRHLLAAGITPGDPSLYRRAGEGSDEGSR
jgi:hypothetical protein